MSKAIVTDSEKMVESVFNRLRSSKKMAEDLFGVNLDQACTATEEAVLGIKERAYPYNDLSDTKALTFASEVFKDLARCCCLARELFGVATPEVVFEIFDDAFIGDDEDEEN